MQWTRFARARAVCAYFFMTPGLTYGLLTSRMPAFKEQTQANEAEIGFIMLALGLSALVGLLSCACLIRRFSSRVVIRVSSCTLSLSIPLCACTDTPLSLGAAVMVLGLSTAVLEVAMNAQAIQIEQRFKAPCLALMQGSYSLGGLMGALSGALFAALGIGPLVNGAVVMGCYLLFWPMAAFRLQQDHVIRSREGDEARPGRRILPPLVVVICGLLAACSYAAEGTIGEWGSLYLFSVKGAPEQTAALVYACFSVSTLVCRLFADQLRLLIPDFWLAFCGGLLAVSGMCIVLLTPAPYCLGGYCCMGLGMAPMVPLCFSHAGRAPGVSPVEASTMVSILAYSGLLLFPPVIGNAACVWGLERALGIALGLTATMTAGSFLFRRRTRDGRQEARRERRFFRRPRMRS